MVETSSRKPVRVLVIEAPGFGDSPFPFELLMNAEQFDAVCVRHLSEALEILERDPFDVILLALFHRDGSRMNTFSQISLRWPEIPIVVVDQVDDRALALEILRQGAQDYLIKDDLDEAHLRRSLLYAIERHRTRVMLHQLTYNDDLTGLLNRRGFLSLAQQQMKIAQRENWELILVFADLDGLKNINDTFGHPEGDRALRTVASILKETFRTTDLIARLGGDEFIVLAINAPASGVKAITARLQENIERANAQGRYYQMSLSYGMVQFNPQRELSLEEMIVKADKALYEDKRKKARVSADPHYRGTVHQ